MLAYQAHGDTLWIERPECGELAIDGGWTSGVDGVGRRLTGFWLGGGCDLGPTAQAAARCQGKL